MLRVIIIFLIIGIIYSFALDKVPVHLNQDELGFSLNAYSIANTGFDENGRFLPLYFWHLGVMYSTPIIVYLTALVLKFLPLSEVTIRIPSIIMGLTDVVLIYFFAKKMFKNQKMGLLAALLLASVPVHFIQSRILLDNLFVVPFILSWLLLLYLYFEKKNIWHLFWGSFLLGFGVHSYHAAKIIMPLYFLMTIVICFKDILRRKVLIVIMLMGFSLPLLPLIPWLSQYPDTLTDQVRYTGLYDLKLNPVQGLISLLTPESLFMRLSIYLSYFDPVFLFFKGDASLIHSTQRIGVFLLPFVILLPLGIFQILKKERNTFFTLLVAGFFSAPFAPAFVGNQYRASKELAILPFAVIIAVFGSRFLFNFFRSNKIKNYLTVLFLLALSAQFAFFLNDYFNDYRIRSYSLFNYNIPGALETAIKMDILKNNKYYLDNRVYFIDRYLKFYAIKHNRLDVLSKSYFIDIYKIKPKELPHNSLIISRFDHVNQALNSLLPQASAIRELDGTVSFYIYRN